MTALFEIGKTYSFDTRAPSILHTSVKNAVCRTIMDFETAATMESNNLYLKYKNILGLLPPGTPTDPSLATYYLFKSESGVPIIFADQWVDPNSIQLVEAVNFKVTVTQANNDDIARVRDALNALGLTYEITQL